MVRTPCCEKMGLKKGPWTPEEDRILINHIKFYGHSNWRQLPRLAGLLRCGKSCRLRWTNYLRPDIKRGNFTKEEEDTIIELHQTLGNRWSAIAAKLPGRTDNEIKNVWHTHLKKRLLKKNQATSEINKGLSRPKKGHKKEKELTTTSEICPQDPPTRPRADSPGRSHSSPQHCTAEISSVTVESNNNKNDDNNNNDSYEEENNNVKKLCMEAESLESFIDMDEDFWSEVLSADNSNMMTDEVPGSVDPTKLQLPWSPAAIAEPMQDSSSVMSDDMEFWFQIFTRAEELTLLPDFE